MSCTTITTCGMHTHGWERVTPLCRLHIGDMCVTTHRCDGSLLLTSRAAWRSEDTLVLWFWEKVGTQLSRRMMVMVMDESEGGLGGLAV
jgi:hypothetical protein